LLADYQATRYARHLSEGTLTFNLIFGFDVMPDAIRHPDGPLDPGFHRDDK